MELLLRHGADPNSANKEGLTPLHVICEYFNSRLIKAFFEITDANHLTIQIDAKNKLGRRPIQLAVASLSPDVVDVRLNRGADPNSANKEGWTSLHVICVYFNSRLIKTFFEITDANHLTIEIDAKDKLGRTPLQLAVVRLFPDIVDVILDRGADLSSSVFPTENYFGLRYENVSWPYLILMLVFPALTIVELLEKRGYELKRSDALTIMKFFDKNEIFKKLVHHVVGLREKEKFMELAKKYRFNSNLSLHELIQLPPEEIKKVLTSMNLCSSNIGIFPSFAENGEACAMHLSDMMSRRFFRRWALESLLELTRHYQMPILCCEIIVKKLANKDLMNICFAVTDQDEA